MPKKVVLSFDIGANHLAYAIISGKKDVFLLQDWELITIFPENEKHECEGIKRNNDACGKNSKYLDRTSTKECNYYCKVHKTENSVEIEKVNFKTVTYQKVAIQFYATLDQYDFSNCTHAIIEKQPKMAAEKMRFIAFMLFGYLTDRCVINGNMKSVAWAPKDKLKFYDGPYIQPKKPIPAGVTRKQKKRIEYENRKAAACKIAEYYLVKYGQDTCEEDSDTTSWLDYFNSSNHDKQDDLADCYIQGLAYMTKNAKKKHKLTFIE